MNPIKTDIGFMQQALACADEAKKSAEVPVGAVLVINQHIVSTAYNQTIQTCDPTAHAEILVLQRAAKVINNHRLIDAVLYVTLEPCLMCVGAMIQARIKRLVFGAYDSRLGAISKFQALSMQGLNHSFALTEGLLAEQCAEKLQQFFQEKRDQMAEGRESV